jgi:hypothetical protein
MDEALKRSAERALLNAFWTDFSALVNAYLKVGEGLNTSGLESEMGVLSSIPTRDRDAVGDPYINIWSMLEGVPACTTGHQTLAEALQQDKATLVSLQGRYVFERNSKGEWIDLAPTGEDE